MLEKIKQDGEDKMSLVKTLWSQMQDLVSTGQHVSDNLDTAFDNIDDAIDQIDTNTLDIVSLKAPPEKIVFDDMTGNEPLHASGQMYYANGALILQDGFTGVSLDIGKQMYMEVLNNTGATIVKGKAVRHNGTTDGKVKITLALADTFVNATILGITAHDIADGAMGVISKFGEVVGFDTSSYSAGAPLYLSPTTAGDFTTVSPIIRTQVGGVIVSHATLGRLFVTIANNAPLPRMLGSLLQATSPTAIPADMVNGTPISGYSDNIEVVTTADKVTGVITPTLNGTYRINLNLHMFFDNIGGAGKKELHLEVRDTTNNVIVHSIKGFILKDAETYDFSINGAISLMGGHGYRIELRSEIALNNFEFSSSTFSIESILY